MDGEGDGAAALHMSSAEGFSRQTFVFVLFTA
jgi:hypothetical protein